MEDVTGDGIDDIIAGSIATPAGTALQAGTVYVLPGGDLNDALTPTVLTQPSPSTNNRLGERLRVGDVTGDGLADVVARWGFTFTTGQNPYAPRGGVLVWEGGPSLASGTPSPWASLRPMRLNSTGLVALPRSLYLRDLSGDGVLDVIGEDALATVHGVSEAGAMLYWRGGSRLQQSPLAAFLGARTPNSSDQYGRTEEIFADLSGDGVLDLTALGWMADVGKTDTGAALFWKGPPLTPSGRPAPHPVYSGGTNAKQPGTVPRRLGRARRPPRGAGRARLRPAGRALTHEALVDDPDGVRLRRGD